MPFHGVEFVSSGTTAGGRTPPPEGPTPGNLMRHRYRYRVTVTVTVTAEQPAAQMALPSAAACAAPAMSLRCAAPRFAAASYHISRHCVDIALIVGEC
jgi:hypothetical protein